MYRLQFALSSLVFLPRILAQTCEVFPVDYADGGSYFQNSLSNDNFTFVSRYEGCDNDVSENILVNLATSKQYHCSNTPLQPDDTPELSTCPIKKSELTSGFWSLEAISNNGDDAPIAQQWDFSLTVGPQATTTFTPTVTLPSTVTPIINSTSTSTFTSTTVLPPATVTSPSTTLHPTVTVTPNPVTSTKTITLITLTILKPTLSIKQVTSTSTATCITPAKITVAARDATITPTIAGITAAALETAAAGAKFRRGPVDRKRQLQELEKRFVGKRAPDFPTITVTDTNTAHYVTTTSFTTAPARTITVISTITSAVTSTPPPVTVISGVSSGAVSTITAPAVTKTKTSLKLFGFVTKTTTVVATVTIDTTVTPTGAAAACTSIGGKLS